MGEVQSVGSDANPRGCLELCEKVASQSELTEDLVTLTRLLELPLDCCLALHQVLKEGNWAKAASPRAYIKKAVKTQARKDETPDVGAGPLVFLDGNRLDQATTRGGIEAALEDESRQSGMLRQPRIKGKHLVPEQFAPDDAVLLREWEAADSGLVWPSDCFTEQQIRVGSSSSSRKLPDFGKLGKKAGLDDWQIQVLEYRRQGISREAAMELQPDGASRKAIQAAWKRFNRKGFQQLQEYLKKNQPENVPEWQFENTKKVEAWSGLKAVISGNPLRDDWKAAVAKGSDREKLGAFLADHRDGSSKLADQQFLDRAYGVKWKSSRP